MESVHLCPGTTANGLFIAHKIPKDSGFGEANTVAQINGVCIAFQSGYR